MMQEALKPEKLSHFAVAGDLDTAIQGKVPASGLVSLVQKPAQGTKKPQQLYAKSGQKHKGKAGIQKPSHKAAGKKNRRG